MPKKEKPPSKEALRAELIPAEPIKERHLTVVPLPEPETVAPTRREDFVYNQEFAAKQILQCGRVVTLLNDRLTAGNLKILTANDLLATMETLAMGFIEWHYHPNPPARVLKPKEKTPPPFQSTSKIKATRTKAAVELPDSPDRAPGGGLSAAVPLEAPGGGLPAPDDGP
jgi:hypothetical protein